MLLESQKIIWELFVEIPLVPVPGNPEAEISSSILAVSATSCSVWRSGEGGNRDDRKKILFNVMQLHTVGQQLKCSFYNAIIHSDKSAPTIFNFLIWSSQEWLYKNYFRKFLHFNIHWSSVSALSCSNLVQLSFTHNTLTLVYIALAPIALATQSPHMAKMAKYASSSTCLGYLVQLSICYWHFFFACGVGVQQEGVMVWGGAWRGEPFEAFSLPLALALAPPHSKDQFLVSPAQMHILQKPFLLQESALSKTEKRWLRPTATFLSSFNQWNLLTF